MTREQIELRRRDAIALMVAADLGAILVAGVGSGLMIRAGVPQNVAYFVGFLGAALILYPVIRTIAALRGKTAPTFARWASAWTVSLLLAAVVLYPLTVRGLDALFP